MDLKPEAKTGNVSGTIEGFFIDPKGIVMGFLYKMVRERLWDKLCWLSLITLWDYKS